MSTEGQRPPQEIRTEIEPLGFELEQILDFLPMQHALIFTAR